MSITTRECIFSTVVCLLCAVLPCSAQLRYDLTPGVRKAKSLLFEMKIDSVRLLMESENARSPDNLLPVYLLNYADFIELFLSEDETRWERLQPELRLRNDLAKSGIESSPWHLYIRAEMAMHSGILEYKFGNTLSAATDFNRAFRLFKRNDALYPDFAPNLKSLGILKAGVGTIPSGYMWLVRLFSSFEGTIADGLTDLLRSIRLGAEENFALREAQMVYAEAVMNFGNDPEEAMQFLDSLDLPVTSNPIVAFVKANAAMKNAENDRAIRILEAYRGGPGVRPVYYLELMLGRAKLFRGDPAADSHLRRYARRYEGKSFIKEAWQKRAWLALIEGRQNDYHRFMDSCLVNGATTTDEDKYAFREASEGKMPHAGLLKARLLFDGGYFTEALAAVNQINIDSLNEEERLELTYRRGRIYQALGWFPEALSQFSSTIDEGRSSSRYFACNAALQGGLIFEQLAKYGEAERYFKLCLELDPNEYRSGLHQKAKAGLNRLRDLRE